MNVGDVFDRLTVVELLPHGQTGVQCACGNQYIVSKDHLARKIPHQCASCGWSKRRICKVGDQYDRLTVTGFEKNLLRTWIVCRCSCGAEVRTRAELLRRNKTNSCGCQPGTLWEGHGEISLTFFHRAKKNAESRNIDFNVSIEFLMARLIQQEHRCALSGLPIQLSVRVKEPCTASVDRIDSALGYTESNVQWVHKEINMMKRDVPQQRFIALCQQVAKLQTQDFSATIEPPKLKTPASLRGRRTPRQ